MGFFTEVANNSALQALAIIASIIGGIITVFGIRYWKRKESVKELDTKPSFQLENIKPHWKREEPEKVRFFANLKNIGNESARDVRISFGYYGQQPSLRKITQESHEMKNSHLPIEGTIQPQTSRPINFQKEWKLREGKLWVVILVMYKFREYEEQCAFISHVIGDCTDGSSPIYYSNEDLNDDNKEWNKLMSGKKSL